VTLITSNVIDERGTAWDGSLIGANGTELTEKEYDMTRKDYIAIAEAIASVRENSYLSGLPQFQAGVDQTTGAIAQALSEDNPRFDRARFFEACGVTA
jgi:hypothetical protein